MRCWNLHFIHAATEAIGWVVAHLDSSNDPDDENANTDRVKKVWTPSPVAGPVDVFGSFQVQHDAD